MPKTVHVTNLDVNYIIGTGTFLMTLWAGDHWHIWGFHHSMVSFFAGSVYATVTIWWRQQRGK